MAQQLGIFNQWFGGEWADRAAINRNAYELDYVENDVASMQQQLRKQASEILWLRAMFMGVVEVLHAKAPFDDAELAAAVQHAWARLNTPPPPPASAVATAITGDPYRGTPTAAAAMHTCTKCGRQVPASSTTITLSGEVCDSCLR
jgi:hypothetical protein